MSGAVKTKHELTCHERQDSMDKKAITAILIIVSAVVALAGSLLTLGASAPKPKLSVADKMAMAKSYSVPCLDCSSSGVLKYRLKPIKVTQGVGNRAVTNGFMQEIILWFRCPVRHEFSAPGPNRFIPAIRAEEEK